MKVEAYKNSDGFITEDKKLYQKRQTLLNKAEKMKENSLMKHGLIAQAEVLTWPQWKQEAISLRLGLHESQCKKCAGTGISGGSYDYCGFVEESCSTCDGTGKA